MTNYFLHGAISVIIIAGSIYGWAVHPVRATPIPVMAFTAWFAYGNWLVIKDHHLMHPIAVVVLWPFLWLFNLMSEIKK